MFNGEIDIKSKNKSSLLQNSDLLVSSENEHNLKLNNDLHKNILLVDDVEDNILNPQNIFKERTFESRYCLYW